MLSDKGKNVRIAHGIGNYQDKDNDTYHDQKGYEEAAAWCDGRVHFHQVERGEPTLSNLAERVRSIEAEHGLSGNRIFYLALPPSAFPSTITRISDSGLNRSPGWVRLVIEKPFGRDFESAHELNELVHANFEETQVYRIDHYLGKETVQNLLVFRFANAIFEPLWNQKYVDHVQLTVAESIGIEGRGNYYEEAGTTRDMRSTKGERA